MTSKVNGKMEILTPYGSETPENVETKIGQNDYIMGPFNPANFRRNRPKAVRSPYSWNITLNCVIPILCVPFLFSLSSPTAKTVGRIFTIYTSNDAASPKDVPFEGFDEKKLFRVSKPHKTLKKWAWLGNFKPNASWHCNDLIGNLHVTIWYAASRVTQKIFAVLVV